MSFSRTVDDVHLNVLRRTVNLVHLNVLRRTAYLNVLRRTVDLVHLGGLGTALRKQRTEIGGEWAVHIQLSCGLHGVAGRGIGGLKFVLREDDNIIKN